MSRPPITLIAAELGLGRAPAARLAATGLVESLADLRTLAARPVLPKQPRTLVVSLGPLIELSPEQAVEDGGWRRYIGWKVGLPVNALAYSAAAWWPAARIPATLVAVTTGGFIVGAWSVTDIDGVHRARYRFTLGEQRPDLLDHRMMIPRGPVARWLDD